MPSIDQIRIHHLEMHSRANGPGERIVVWTQGCTLNCPGCFNPLTHPIEGGQVWSSQSLADHIASQVSNHEGITISGGEPLLQQQALFALLSEVKRRTHLSVILFSGFSWEEIQKFPEAQELLDCIDIIIAGRYQASLRLAYGLRGSENKTIINLSNRYTLQDLEQVPPSEVILEHDGSITLSGVNPLSWK